MSINTREVAGRKGGGGHILEGGKPDQEPLMLRRGKNPKPLLLQKKQEAERLN